ncbi:MAG TPA: hypothetical protein VJL88_01705 [Nitrospira sp.]|nr:hypothetical protein [Nitrospira sp.]
MHWACCLLGLLFAFSGDRAVAESPSHEEPALHEGHDDDRLQERPGEDTVTSMAEPHAHVGPHFRWTVLRTANDEDRRRAETLVTTLRQALEPYRDYHRAIADGYEPFLPNVVQSHYHFTSKWRGFKSAFRFNAAQPTSLLYKKTSKGYELEGAMYTAPKRTSESELDKRVPLSVARWHAHVNICLPPKRSVQTADWSRFGPKGTIVTEAECDQAKGRWVPQLFGWMIHVYPLKDTPETIWTH